MQEEHIATGSQDAEQVGPETEDLVPVLSMAHMEARVEQLSTENNELKKEVSDLKDQLFGKDTASKAMSLQVQRLEEENAKLKAENESLRVARKEMMAIPMRRSKRTAKGTLKLSETVGEQHLGLALQVDKVIPQWCRKEVSELEQFSEKPKRNWTLRGDVVAERGIPCTGGIMVAPHPPLEIARQGRLFTASTVSEQVALQSIVQHELEGDGWKALKTSEEFKKRTVQELSRNADLRSQMKRHMSDSASYKKRVIRDALFSAFQYDKLLSKLSVKGDGYAAEKQKQASYAKEKLLKKVDGRDTYDMAWWRLCPDASQITYKEEESQGSETVSAVLTQFPDQEIEPVRETGRADATQNDEDEDDEETYGLFRNDAARQVWRTVRSVMSGDRKKQEGEDEDMMDSTIVLLARVDAWIMTVVSCTADEQNRGGRRQRLYVETFEKFLPISMDQITKAMYRFVMDWEPDDLTIEKTSVFEEAQEAETPEEKVFGRKYGACTPVYVPTVQKAYLAIEPNWFARFVGDELGSAADCYIAEFSVDYEALKPIEMVGSAEEAAVEA